MENKQNIALIFFSRTSVFEARNQSWFAEASKNNDVASLLIEKAKTTIEQAGIPVYHFHENNQKGSSFGARIANAYQEVFDLGYEQVISVGNDCPDLKNINWHDISTDLANGKCVLGPDKRGGAYLIGIQKQKFNQEQFERLNWQKNTLYVELAQLCKNSAELVELERYRDLNSFQDIRLLLKVKASQDKFFKLISQLLQPLKKFAVQFQIEVHDFHLFKDSPLRAPPIK